MAIQLTDDGTLDTVLRCSECGEEMRYNDDQVYFGYPLEWLSHTINDCENLQELKDLAKVIAGNLDGDQIQDIFQSDMEADGYFHTREDFITESIEDAESEHECTATQEVR